LYNSCGDRHCPQCAGAKRRDWLTKTSQLLLPDIDYYQVVFTMPDRLSSLALGNRRELFDLLFHTAPFQRSGFACFRHHWPLPLRYSPNTPSPSRSHSNVIGSPSGSVPAPVSSSVSPSATCGDDPFSSTTSTGTDKPLISVVTWTRPGRNAAAVSCRYRPSTGDRLTDQSRVRGEDSAPRQWSAD